MPDIDARPCPHGCDCSAGDNPLIGCRCRCHDAPLRDAARAIARPDEDAAQDGTHAPTDIGLLSGTQWCWTCDAEWPCVAGLKERIAELERARDRWRQRAEAALTQQQPADGARERERAVDDAIGMIRDWAKSMDCNDDDEAFCERCYLDDLVGNLEVAKADFDRRAASRAGGESA